MTWWQLLIVLVFQGLWSVACMMIGAAIRERADLQRMAEEQAKWHIPDQEK